MPLDRAATIHAPERQPSETQAQYRKRRVTSKLAARVIERGVAVYQFVQHTNPSRNRTSNDARWLGQLPKIAKPRKHKQHVHGLRDDHGAFTWVGRTQIRDEGWNLITQHRNVWLAGISAQRGY